MCQGVKSQDPWRFGTFWVGGWHLDGMSSAQVPGLLEAYYKGRVKVHCRGFRGVEVKNLRAPQVDFVVLG